MGLVMRSRMLPIRFRARLPALVALMPLAEYPLIRLGLVMLVCCDRFVETLCTPLLELVEFVFVVNVLARLLPRSSKADFRFRIDL